VGVKAALRCRRTALFFERCWISTMPFPTNRLLSCPRHERLAAPRPAPDSLETDRTALSLACRLPGAGVTESHARDRALRLLGHGEGRAREQTGGGHAKHFQDPGAVIIRDQEVAHRIDGQAIRTYQPGLRRQAAVSA